jgi:hypothetical protein
MTEENFSAEAPVTGKDEWMWPGGANTGDESPDQAKTATTAKSRRDF